MEVRKTGIEGVYVIEPRLFFDSRGQFFESFNEKEFFEKTGVDFHPVQDNESKSFYGVLRGLHFQKEPYSQAKLVRVVKGEVFDVAVDLRHDSPTRGKYVAIVLSEKNKKQFFIPKGFAHGFVVLSDDAVFQYKCDEYYNPDAEGGIYYADETLGIIWPVSIQDIKLSAKDTKWGTYDEYIKASECPGDRG